MANILYCTVNMVFTRKNCLLNLINISSLLLDMGRIHRLLTALEDTIFGNTQRKTKSMVSRDMWILTDSVMEPRFLI